MKLSPSGLVHQAQEGEKKSLNSELWHACAGPLVSLPTVGSQVVYFPQGHSEQVAASTNKEVNSHIPNYPSLSPQLICQLHDLTMHADTETDEVYAQMTLQPLSAQVQKDTYLPAELGVPCKQPTNYFCKTLTASDTSTHGGFSVPRRAAEKVFPPLDFSQQPPAQELVARDLHDVEWKFRHIFRGQPKRHLLTTGWSVFVSAKRLVAGDSVIFIWNEKNQLLLGIRHASRPQTIMPSSVLSSDSMHIGLLAAAAHAASTNSRFTIFYNPRASPSEFVIPLSKYVKAVFHTRISDDMRFRMLFETEESSVRRYMGRITGVSDLDPIRWPNSYWRSVKVVWDESTAGERHPRVSMWEIEPLTTFPMYPSLFPLRLKRPWHLGLPSLQDNKEDQSNALEWLRGCAEEQRFHSLNFPALGMAPGIQPRLDPLFLGSLHGQYEAMAAAALQDIRNGDPLKQLFLHFQQPFQSPQQSPCGSHPQLLQQIIQQTQPQQILQARTHSIPENQPQNQQQQRQQTHHDVFRSSDNHPQQPPLPSGQCQKTVFPDSNAYASPAVPSCTQNIMGSLSTEESTQHLSFSRLGQPLVVEQHQQPWVSMCGLSPVGPFGNSISLPPFPGRDCPVEPENCGAEPHGPVLFGVNIDHSSIIAPNAVLSIGNVAGDADVTAMPYAARGFQSSLHGCIDESSGLPEDGGQPPTRTFVKVYKSGSVGRSLDITQFSSYHELREELDQMFGLGGQLEDPLRSGWQLVFVDRENDVLLLGDDPWDVFVNNVWYIKILSPEDMQKMGKDSVESLNPTVQRQSSSNSKARSPNFGIPAIGSLKY